MQWLYKEILLGSAAMAVVTFLLNAVCICCYHILLYFGKVDDVFGFEEQVVCHYKICF